MFTILYEKKHLECPYCGENETWDMAISDNRWIEVVNEFIAEHRECEGESILGLENTKAERNSK